MAILARDANTGAGQNFTGLAAAVRLRLRVAFGSQALQGCTGETSAQIRERVIAARRVQQARFAARPRVTCNARMGARELKAHCALDSSTLDLLKLAMTEKNLSARAYDRILKVARTIADLAAAERLTADRISEAIQFRSLDRQIWG